MTTEIRKTGIDVVGDMVAWGAHFCLFYETREDLLDTLIEYCKSGLGREEYCLWIDTWRTPGWKLCRPAIGFSRAARLMARD